MADKGKKLLEKAKNSPANWSVNELEQLYIAYGFEIVRKSKHAFAVHSVFKELRGTIPNHKSFSADYVRNAVKLIEKLEERQHAAEDEQE